MKKIYVFLCILTDLLALALIPLDLVAFAMPEWLTLVIIGLAVLLLVVFFKKGNGKILSKTILSILFVLMAGISLFGTYCNPYWNSTNFRKAGYTEPFDKVLTYEQAKEDIDTCMHYLKKDHPLFMKKVPKEVQSRYEKALKELKEADQIDTTLVRQKCQNILSVMKDAHTHAYPNFRSENIHYLKYIRARNNAEDVLTAVDGIEIKELLKERSDLYSYEVESWGIERLNEDLSTLEGLYFLGFSAENGIDLTYEAPDGTTDTVTYFKDDFVTYDEYKKFNKMEDDTDEETSSFVSYEIDSERSLAVLTLTECIYNDEYRNCLREMFTKVKEQEIKNVAVDIRDNGGGNSLVTDEFIRYLNVDEYKQPTFKWRFGVFYPNFGGGLKENQKYTDLTFNGKVYVLTSSGSFSSAMLFAEYMTDNDLATLIGEAPGNVPSGYGDIAIFRLPNSGIYVNVSTKQFVRADKETKDILVEPDINCDADEAKEYLNREVEKE